MNKKIRRAVRTYLIKDNRIIVIRYKQNLKGYYDIPGGKIEENETPEETSIREFREETGISITKQHYLGKALIEFPDIIFDLNIFIVDEYNGEPLEFEENVSMWIDINDLYNETKKIPDIEIIKYLKDNMNLKIICESNDRILAIKNMIDNNGTPNSIPKGSNQVEK